MNVSLHCWSYIFLVEMINRYYLDSFLREQLILTAFTNVYIYVAMFTFMWPFSTNGFFLWVTSVGNSEVAYNFSSLCLLFTLYSVLILKVNFCLNRNSTSISNDFAHSWHVRIIFFRNWMSWYWAACSLTKFYITFCSLWTTDQLERMSKVKVSIHFIDEESMKETAEESVKEMEEELRRESEQCSTSTSAEGTDASLSNKHCVSEFRLLLHCCIWLQTSSEDTYVVKFWKLIKRSSTFCTVHKPVPALIVYCIIQFEM